MFTGMMARGLGHYTRIAAMVLWALLAVDSGRLMAEENLFGDESSADKSGDAKDVEPISWNVKPMATTSPASQPATRPASTKIALPSDIASIVYPSNSSAAIGLICTARLNPRIICMDPVANVRLGEIKGTFASANSRQPEVRISPDGLMVMNVDEEKDVLVVRCANLTILPKPTAIPNNSLAWFDFVKSEKVILYRGESTAGEPRRPAPRRIPRRVSPVKPSGNSLGAPSDDSPANSSGDLELWDIKTSRKLWSKPVEGKAHPSTLAVSPDGRYLALQAVVDPGYQLQVYDLATGEMVGQTPIINPVKENSYSARQLQPAMMTFSPDGKELASVWAAQDPGYGTPTPSTLFVWDFTNGRVKFAFPYSDRSPDNMRMNVQYDLRDIRKDLDHIPIQWVNNVGWIAQGRLLISRDTRQVVFDFCDIANDKTLRFMRMLNNQNVLLGKTVAGTGILQETPLPMDKILAAIGNAKAGGTLSDSKLPPLTKTDFSKTQLKQIASAAAWSVQWAPATSPTTGPAKAQTVRSFKFPGTITAGKGFSSSIKWINRPAQAPGTVFVNFSPDYGSGKSNLVWVDLATNVLNQMTLQVDKDYKATLSLDGSRLATFNGSRIDVFSIKEKKHLVSWKMQEYTSPGSHSSPYQDYIDDARFVSADRVFTVGNGRATLWQLPQCQAIYVGTLSGGGRACFSPDNRYLITNEGKVIETATGDLKGVLQPYKTGMYLSYNEHFAVSPDGQSLVRGVEDMSGFTLLFYDMQTGRIKSTLLCGGVLGKPGKTIDYLWSGPLVWSEPDYIQIGSRLLISLKHKRLVWIASYELYSAYEHPHDGLGQYWLQGKDYVFTPVPMMDASIRQKIEEEAPKLPPAMITPGMKISIDYQLSPTDNPEEFKKEIMAALTKRLQICNFEVVDSGGDLRLLLSTSPGQSTPYGKGFFGVRANDAVEVSVNSLECKTAVLDAKGQVLLEQSTSCIPKDVVCVDNNLGPAVIRAQWRMSKVFFLNCAVSNPLYTTEVVGNGPIFGVASPKKDSTGSPTGGAVGGGTPGGGVIKNPPRRIMPPRRS